MELAITTSERLGLKIGASRTYYMNQNYLFSDNLAKIGNDFMKFKSTPEIQPLILNEYQPYDTMSIADILPNIASHAAGLVLDAVDFLGNTIKNTLKTGITNALVDFYSNHPEELYNKDKRSFHRNGKRTLFTTDPIEQIQNMFNGGIWLNTFEIPFYGNDYLKAKYSDKWEVGGIASNRWLW